MNTRLSTSKSFKFQINQIPRTLTPFRCLPADKETLETRLVWQLIYETRDTVFHHISNTEKRVENTTRSGVFLSNFEVFDFVMKHCDECLI